MIVFKGAVGLNWLKRVTVGDYMDWRCRNGNITNVTSGETIIGTSNFEFNDNPAWKTQSEQMLKSLQRRFRKTEVNHSVLPVIKSFRLANGFDDITKPDSDEDNDDDGDDELFGGRDYNGSD